MTTIKLETRIAAPALRVFLLSLSVDLHKASTKKTSEEAIAGVTSGIMGPGDVVTWRARHFGLRLTHTSEISRYQPPDSSPLGPLGAIVDWFVLKAYLTRFLAERKHLIQQVAESTEWNRFIPGALQSECL